MMRHFIKPVLAKYGRAEVGFGVNNSYVKLPLFCRLEKNRSFLENLAVKTKLSAFKRKRNIRSVSSVVCILSGCCFSKSSNDESNLESDERSVNLQKSSIDNQKSVPVANTYVSFNENDETQTPLDETHTPLLSKQANSKDSYNEKTRKLSASLLCNDLPKVTLPTFSDNLSENFEKIKRRKVDSVAEEEAFGKLDDGNVCLEEEKGKKKKKKKKQKESKVQPNYFIAFQISNPEVHQNLTEVQKHILEQDKRLARSMVSVLKSHITLMVMHLGNEEQHAKALGALKEAHEELNISMSKCPLTLQFQGIGNFRNQVVFAKISDDEGLLRLHGYAESVENHFNNASIVSTDGKRSFNPHLTLMKLSKDPTLYRKGIKKINPAFYEAFKDQAFGNQVVKSIQLLSMYDPAGENGYYAGSELLFDI